MSELFVYFELLNVCDYSLFYEKFNYFLGTKYVFDIDSDLEMEEFKCIPS